MKDFLTIIIVTFIFIGIFISAISVGENTIDNSLMSDNSKQLIKNISTYQEDRLDDSEFSEGESELATNNSDFSGQDSFSRKFFESKSSTQKKTNLIQRITQIPDLILISIGIPSEFTSPFKWIIASILTIFISFATYRAFFGPRRVTD